MDLQHNALVSIFLRYLEYYIGVLILTSNRVGTFDEAFKSRIHLAIHYRAPDEADRFKMWRGCLEILHKDAQNFSYDELKQKLNVLARYRLNGRQIRNTFTTAMQLAKYRKEKFAYTHVHQAIEIMRDFEEYIEKINGHTSEEWTRSLGIRHDEYQAPITKFLDGATMHSPPLRLDDESGNNKAFGRFESSSLLDLM
jgi:hypothetical protein